MRTLKMTPVFFALCIIALIAPLCGDLQARPASPTRQSVDTDVLAATVPTTGTLVLKFTVALKSALPTNGKVVCDAHAILGGTDAGLQIFERAFSFATLSAGVWSCTVNIPYSWALTSPGTDTIALTYAGSIQEGFQITASNSTATVVLAPLATRQSNIGLGTLAVPANGAITTKNFSVTL
ncbi:MAG TPA: hypothetical protein VFI95_09980 [Terriglobales bacterium]|nr:hypothetical protein [Terriglobales bacterium]